MLNLGTVKTIHIASTSDIKRDAVLGTIKSFTLFKDAEVKCHNINSPLNPE